MWLRELVVTALSFLSPAQAPATAPAVAAPPAAAPMVAPAPPTAAPPAAPAPDAKSDAKLDALVDAVQKTYDATTDFSASFTQKYTYTLLRRTQESTGKVSLKKPGLMRWDYATPQPKAFVVDGKSLWISQPADQNVFVNACFQQSSDLVAPIAFMWGAGKIREQFSVSWFAGTFGDKTDAHLELLPKTPSPAFAKLILVVDTKTSRVKQSIVVDPSGNVNQFIFKDASYNKKPADSAFKFTPPAGAHIARMPGSCTDPIPGVP
jgi:outer membrane lipoprotein carrier protein